VGRQDPSHFQFYHSKVDQLHQIILSIDQARTQQVILLFERQAVSWPKPELQGSGNNSKNHTLKSGKTAISHNDIHSMGIV
jgi:hypothetical protein